MAFIAWGDYVRDMTPSVGTPVVGQFKIGDDFVTTDETNLQSMRLAETCTFNTDSTGYVGHFKFTDGLTEVPLGIVAILGLKIVDTATGQEISGNYDMRALVLAESPFAAIAYDVPYTGVFGNQGILLLPRNADGSQMTGSEVILSLGQNNTTKELTVTAGRIWIGPAWELPSGIDARWETSIVDPGRMYFSDGHQGYNKILQRYRELKASLQVDSFADAYGNSASPTDDCLLDMFAEIGTTDEVIAVPRSVRSGNYTGLNVNDFEAVKTGVYGTMKRIEPIRHISGGNFETGFTLRELL